MVSRLLAILGAAAFLPGCLGGNGYTPIRTSFNKGVHQYSKGNYEAAIAEYRDAVSEDPADHRSRFNLALALETRASELGRDPAGRETADRMKKEAESIYRALLEDRPDDVRAAVNLAAMEYEQGEREAGLGRLRRAIEEHPGVALPQASLAAHEMNEGRHQEARRLLLEAKEQEPEDAMTNALLGEAALVLGFKDEARAAFEIVLRRDPIDASTLLAIGRLEEESGNTAAAIEYLRRAVLADPGSYVGHLRLSELYAKDDLTLEDAVYHLWRARDIGRPDGPDRSARLVDLYQRLIERERR